MRNFGFIQLFIGSFYNPETYRDVVKNQKGKVFGYLVFLVLLCSIPLMVSIINGVKNFMVDDGAFIISQVPEIKINNGIVSIDKESPCFIKSKAGETIIVIDVSDSAGITELQGTAKVLLTKNKLIALQKENETRSYDLTPIKNFSLNPQIINEWYSYAWIVYVIIFAGILIALFIYRLVQALINGILGLIISAILRINLDYSSLLYIAIVAITPVAVIASVIWATGAEVPFRGWLGFIMAIGYISFGIMANKPQPLLMRDRNFESGIAGDESNR